MSSKASTIRITLQRPDSKLIGKCILGSLQFERKIHSMKMTLILVRGCEGNAVVNKFVNRNLIFALVILPYVYVRNSRPLEIPHKHVVLRLAHVFQIIPQHFIPEIAADQ